MGNVRTRLRLGNGLDPAIPRVECEALAGTGAAHLCLPPQVAARLRLQEQDKRDLWLPDGTRRLVPYSGPVQVEAAGRQCFVVGALVLGDAVLLGSIPLDDMELVVAGGGAAPLTPRNTSPAGG